MVYHRKRILLSNDAFCCFLNSFRCIPWFMDVTCWEVLEDWQILSANTKGKSTFDRGTDSHFYVKDICFRYN
jgi:hypothetical protein